MRAARNWSSLEGMPSVPPRCAAAITAGGQSRRFGQDKALYKVGGLPLLHRVAASLDSFAPRMLIAPAGKYRASGSLPRSRSSQATKK